MIYKFSKTSLERLSKIDNRLQLLANEIIKITEIDVGIPKTGGWRPTPMQQEMFKIGASPCDGIIKKSKHQDGLAFDFVCYKDGEITWEKEYYGYIVGLAEVIARNLNIDIRCGAWFTNIKGGDWGHIELLT